MSFEAFSGNRQCSQAPLNRRPTLLDIVVSKGTAILQLLAGKDEALLVRRDALFVLNLALHIVNAVTGLNLKCDSFASQRLDKNLHAAAQPQHQMKGRLCQDKTVFSL